MDVSLGHARAMGTDGRLWTIISRIQVISATIITIPLSPFSPLLSGPLFDSDLEFRWWHHNNMPCVRLPHRKTITTVTIEAQRAINFRPFFVNPPPTSNPPFPAAHKRGPTRFETFDEPIPKWVYARQGE